MLKRFLCQATFDWELSCEGPLLINDGRYPKVKPGGKSQGYPDQLFISRLGLDGLTTRVKTIADNPPGDLPFYVPGTSIRGPFRAHAERIVRTLCAEDARPPDTACDPFQDEPGRDGLQSCSKRLEAEGKGAPPYARACPACRIFGCAGLAGRTRFSDADIEGGFRSGYRDMIGIDRFTGGVYTGSGGEGGANMRLHVLEGAKFKTRITITNYELWHLGLLGYVLQDFADGLVAIGFGKTKGFGQVKGEVTGVELTFSRPPRGLEHMGSLMADGPEKERYKIQPEACLEGDWFEPASEGAAAAGWLHRRAIGGSENIAAFLSAVKPKFNDFLERLAEKEAP